MGQYGNQPDFGTIVNVLEDFGINNEFPPSAIYVGQLDTNETECAITVLPVGNAPGQVVTITGIQAGTFLPIIAVKITSIESVSDKDVLLYR